MLDGYRANALKLADVGLLYRTLCLLPDLIGMRKVGFPHIIEFTEGDIAGLSGFIFIVESHISVHTYARARFLTMDVYSCKPFDHVVLARYIEGVYETEEVDTRLIERGVKFPASVT
jgi:S-adenosylmethionine decarboxylase